jgi:hypothetical protein
MRNGSAARVRLPVTDGPSGSPTPAGASRSAASQTVQSGAVVVFDETTPLAADAPQDTTLQCAVPFTLNGAEQVRRLPRR